MTTTAKRSTTTNGSRSPSTTAQPRPPELFADGVTTKDADAIKMLAESATERPRSPFAIAPVVPIPVAASWPTGCRVFSSTLRDERNLMGEWVTEIIRRVLERGGHLTEYQVAQSSDNGFHCLSIVLFYALPPGAPPL